MAPPSWSSCPAADVRIPDSDSMPFLGLARACLIPSMPKGSHNGTGRAISVKP